MKTTLRKLTAAWPLMIFLLLPALTRAETAVQAWVQRYNGPVNGDAYASAMAVDGSNNIVVTGYSPGSGSGNDYATIKYSSAGVPIWTNRSHETGSYGDYAQAVKVDGNDNVIVTGPSLTGSACDYVTIKYSGAGVPLWTNRYNGPESLDDQARALAVDGSNAVIVAGESGGFMGGNYHYATIKYSSAGVPLWTNRYYGPSSQARALAVAVDGSNNVIVTGQSSSSDTGGDYTTIKYSSEGDPLWTNRYTGPGSGYDLASAMAVDGSNNVIVTGWSAGSGSKYDYATIKYSSAGVALWTNRYNGSANGDDLAQAIAVDRSNDVIVTGYSTRSPGSTVYATIKYSNEGVPLWTNFYNASYWAQAYALAVGDSNSVIVTGYSSWNGSSCDYATIKYSAAGVPLWTNLDNGPADGAYPPACAMALDHSGHVIVVGKLIGSGGNYDFATMAYICVPSPVMTGLQVADGTFQLRVDDLLQPGTLVIEACTNLAGWAPVFTNTTPTNVLFYTDPDASNAPRRFYRASQFP